ncbi:MAG: fibronectin type III domain-containing protein [Acidobacteria bacterium]|nr:fibronectin type III domain-containing protein [Acidobacteriota bacterium]
MVDVSVLPPTVEVQWETGTWTDATNDLREVDLLHGSARVSNPDRPTVASAAGSITLSGRLTAGRRGRRFRARISRTPSAVLWEGWIQEPDQTASADPAVRWRIAGLLTERLQQEAMITAAARTVAATIADSTLWTGLVGAAASAAQLPVRSLKAVIFEGRTGRFVSQFASVAGARPLERRRGGLRFAAPAVSAAPADAVTLDSAAVIVNSARSEDRADRIRNRATLQRQLTSADTFSADVEVRLTGRANGRGDTEVLTASGSIPITPEAGVTYSNWAVSVLRAWADVMAYTGLVGGSLSSVQQTAWFGTSHADEADRGRVGEAPLSGADLPAAAVGTPTASAVPVSASWQPGRPAANAVPFTVTQRWYNRQAPGGPRIVTTDVVNAGPRNATDHFWRNPTESYEPNFSTLNDLVRWGPNTARIGGLPLLGLGAVLRVTADITRVSDPVEIVVSNNPSILQWGLRPLVLVDWLAGSTDLTAQIDYLAELRHEHIIEVPLRQPTAAAQAVVDALDAGDYVNLTISDPARNVDIRELCLVVSRGLRYRKDVGAVLRFRCLETGVAPPAPTQAPATPTGLAAAALTETSIAVSCDSTTGAASYQFRHRVDGTSAWTVVDAGMTPLATITGLAASTTYDVQVRATNAIGSSAWSSTVSVDTPAPAVAAPHTPTGLNVSAVSSSSVSAAYMAAATGGAASSFQLRHRIGTGAWTVVDVNPPLAGSMTITGLAASTTYEVQVRARNAVGDSPWSSGVNVTTRPTTPTNLTLQAAGTTVTAAVDTVAGATGYGWRIREQGSSQWQTSTTSAATQTIPGLTAGATYEIQARASNSAGDSPWTATRTVTISATPPGPTITELRRRQSGQVYDLLVRFQSQRTSGTVASYLQGVRPRSSATDQNPSWNQELTRTTSSTFNNRWFLGIPPSTQYEIYGSVTYTDGVTSDVSVVQLATPILSGESYPARTLTLDAAPVTVDDNPIALRETTTIEEPSDD